MKREYISLFEKAAPRMSDEELFESVLAISSSRKGSITMKNNTQKSENKSKKFFSKAVVIPLAAALALGATAVGAVAVYNRNVTEEYARVLQQEDWVQRQELVDKDGNKIDENLKAVSNGLYDKLNIELNKTFKCNGFTVEFPGAIYDGEAMLIFYNVTFTEGQEFDPYDHLSLEPKDYFFGGEGIYGYLRGIRGEFEKVDGNMVFHGCVSLDNMGTYTENMLSINFTSLEGGLDGFGYVRRSFNLDITLEIPLSADLTKYNKTVEVPSAPHIDLGNWGDWNINEVKVTPLSLTVNSSTDHETPAPTAIKEFDPVYPVVVTFKDGSVLDLTSQIGTIGIDDEKRTFKHGCRLDYPIDVENVATIQFASAVIDMDGNATTVEIPEVYEKYDENGHLVVR